MSTMSPLDKLPAETLLDMVQRNEHHVCATPGCPFQSMECKPGAKYHKYATISAKAYFAPHGFNYNYDADIVPYSSLEEVGRHAYSVFNPQATLKGYVTLYLCDACSFVYEMFTGWTDNG